MNSVDSLFMIKDDYMTLENLKIEYNILQLKWWKEPSVQGHLDGRDSNK